MKKVLPSYLLLATVTPLVILLTGCIQDIVRVSPQWNRAGLFENKIESQAALYISDEVRNYVFKGGSRTGAGARTATVYLGDALEQASTQAFSSIFSDLIKVNSLESAGAETFVIAPSINEYYFDFLAEGYKATVGLKVVVYKDQQKIIDHVYRVDGALSRFAVDDGWNTEEELLETQRGAAANALIAALNTSIDDLFANGAVKPYLVASRPIVTPSLQATNKVAAKVVRSPPLTTAQQPIFPSSPVDVTFPEISPRPDDIAVIIGNADYSKLGKDIPDVTPAHADAAGIRKYAVQALGIREGNIIDMRDATSAQLVQVFGSERNHKGKVFDWVKPGVSRIFVYYAGHGAPGGGDASAYIVPVDAEAQRVELSGYLLSTLYANLSKVPAESITVVLEACFSGVSEGGSVISNASPVYLKTKAPQVPDNITVIAAGGSNQMASWDEDRKHSLFTKYFLMGMSGEADASPYGNGDGKVNFVELEKYLDGTMTYLARRYYGRDQAAQIVIGRDN
ncbi:MAG: caspase family protein [Rhodospirillales bacterium]|nr:caspase family protein [Rhodospirillales bacterium]